MHGTAGKRRYKCTECGTHTFFSRREESRAARLRCSGCGSARLEISVQGAEKLAEALDEVRDVKYRVSEAGTGSVVPGTSIGDNRR